VCATPLPQDDSGRLACPWAFSRVGSSILGSDWPCPVSEVDGVRWSRFSVPSFPHRTRKDGAPACLAGVRFCGPASWETQGPSAALGMTDCFGAPARGRSRLHWWQCIEQQVPRLCHRIRFANPMALLGMTSFCDRRSGRLSSRECCWHWHADRSVRATRSFAEKLSSPLFGVILCMLVIAGHK